MAQVSRDCLFLILGTGQIGGATADSQINEPGGITSDCAAYSSYSNLVAQDLDGTDNASQDANAMVNR